MENIRVFRKDECGNKFCYKIELESSCGFGVGNMEICYLRKNN